MELSDQQQTIVRTAAPRVIVNSAPASGKTRVLTERINYLLEQGADPKGIVAITFTVSASTEMVDRLGDKSKGAFIGTVHAYANYLLRSRGIDTSILLDDEKFDLLFPLVKQHPECIRPVKYLLLDEAQDSTPEQFEFLLDMIKPENFMLVGDYRQSIFRWAKADPQFLINLSRQPNVVTYDLNENYRNGRSILSYAKSIIQLAGYEYLDESTPMREEAGRVIVTDYKPKILAQSIAAWGEYKDWFVLTRTNDQIDEFTQYLTEYNVPCDTFKRSQINNKELYERLQGDKVKVLTIHTSKGLEAKNVMVIGAKFYNLEEKCISYVAATRARDLLVWTKAPVKPRRPKDITNWES